MQTVLIKQVVDFANTLAQKGAHEDAIQELQQALNSFPENHILKLSLAGQYLSINDLGSAEKILLEIKSPNEAVRLKVMRILAGISLASGPNNADQAWSRIETILPKNAPTDVRRVFKKTVSSRIRTNSLYSDWISSDHTNADAARNLEKLAADAIERRTPFSLIRLGDGEGLVLNRERPQLLGATRFKGGSYPVSSVEYEQVLSSLQNACENASVLGLPREDMVSEQYISATNALNDNIKERLIDGQIALTDCHCHYALDEIGAINRLIESAEHIGYVGCRDVTAHIKNVNPRASFTHYEIPPQASFGELHDEPHFPFYFGKTQEALSVPNSKNLFLVAAGVLGKIYCDTIKKRGGVAIDIGAIADAWSGRYDTRPFIERNYSPLGHKK